jgi:hypothetical protein
VQNGGLAHGRFRRDCPAFLKYGSKPSQLHPDAPRVCHELYSAALPRWKNMALMVDPPPTTLAHVTPYTLPSRADWGVLSRGSHRYGTGKYAPETRTPSSPLSNGPYSITRTLTARVSVQRRSRDWG